jgi:type I restriction enzyme S subunit
MSLPRYPKYKDSGVKWLGEVPERWDTRRIRFLFQIKKRIAGAEGYDVLSITQQGVKVKDIESNDGQLAMDYSKYQFVEIGDFAMNHMDLLTGYVDISGSFGVTSPDYRVFSMRDTDANNHRYFLHIFQNAYRQKIFYAFGQGASHLGRWRLPTDQFQDFALPLPSLPEQSAIAAFLDREIGKIDALVEEQRRLIELLKEKRQAVISNAVTKGINSVAPMKDSGIEWLGNVPEHWNIAPLRRVISEHLSNGIFKKRDEFGLGVPLVNVSDVYREDFKVNFDSLDRVSCDEREIAAYLVIAGDLFFVRSSLKQEGIAAVALAGDMPEPVVY